MTYVLDEESIRKRIEDLTKEFQEKCDTLVRSAHAVYTPEVASDRIVIVAKALLAQGYGGIEIEEHFLLVEEEEFVVHRLLHYNWYKDNTPSCLDVQRKVCPGSECMSQK